MLRMSLNWRTLAYGLGFGALDATALPIVKGVSTGWNPLLMIIPVVLYGISPFILLSALKQETLTIMNLVWDLTSDLTVTFIGLVGFAEKISPIKSIGIVFSFIGLVLMTYENENFDNVISSNVSAFRSIFAT